MAKITPAALDAWGRIMAAVPVSMMLMVGLGYLEPEACQRIATAMAAHGVHPSRIRFEREKRHPDLLAAYGNIDIALDTWPYTGGLTTLEALWAGVPVVAMAGDGMHARHAAAHLSAAGLSDLVATRATSPPPLRLHDPPNAFPRFAAPSGPALPLRPSVTRGGRRGRWRKPSSPC